MNDTLRGLRDALDAYPSGDPMRSAIQAGIDRLLDKPETLPTDNRARDALTGRPITFRGTATCNGNAIPHITAPLPPKLF